MESQYFLGISCVMSLEEKESKFNQEKADMDHFEWLRLGPRNGSLLEHIIIRYNSPSPFYLSFLPSFLNSTGLAAQIKPPSSRPTFG